MRITEKEHQIKSLYEIDVEFCEPYTGKYGTKDYVAEIFFLGDAKARAGYNVDIQDEKRDLIDLVMLANQLHIPINNDNLNTGIICRHTEGIRATNQILFKDQATLDKFKAEINFLWPIQSVSTISVPPLKQNSIFPSINKVKSLEMKENKTQLPEVLKPISDSDSKNISRLFKSADLLNLLNRTLNKSQDDKEYERKLLMIRDL